MHAVGEGSYTGVLCWQGAAGRGAGADPLTSGAGRVHEPAAQHRRGAPERASALATSRRSRPA